MPLTSHLGEIAALGTAIGWTGSALAFAAAGRRIGSLVVNLLRLAIAVVLLAAAAWVIRGMPLPLDAPASAWGWLALSGLVGFVFGDLCLFRAFLEIGPRLSSLMMCLAPPFAALIGWMALGDRLGTWQLAGMTLVVVGIAIAVLDRQPAPRPDAPVATFAAPPTAATIASRRPPLRGVLLAVGGALGQAGGLVLSKHGMGSYHALAATQIRVFAGLLGFALLFSIARLWHRVMPALADRPGLGYTALGAFFGPFLGVTLSLYAVQHAPTGVAAALMATTPILILPIEAWSGRERVGVRAIAGAALAVGGVALLFY